MDVKYCTKCGEVKPLTDFHNSKKTRDGYSYCCKQCKFEYNRMYIGRNLDHKYTLKYPRVNVSRRRMEVLNIVLSNPKIKLREIGERLGISRQAVEVHIRRLEVVGLLSKGNSHDAD